MSKIHFKRVGPYELTLPLQDAMAVPASVFVSEKIPVEPEALSQLADAASLPNVARVLATPDIHVGYGVPIGGVVAAEDFISPAAVGYDINCGMRLIATPWNAAEVDIRSLAFGVRQAIPLGEGKANIRLAPEALKATLKEGVPGLLAALKKDKDSVLVNAHLLSALDFEEEEAIIERIERNGSLPGDLRAVPGRAFERGAGQLATLGGGNHFIEFQRVEHVVDPATAARWGLHEGQLTVMIHSGSRGLGHEIGSHYMQSAALFDREHKISVPNAHLAILPLDSDSGKDYMGAMHAAANYAFANRTLMAVIVKNVLRRRLGQAQLQTIYDVAHNLASLERHHNQQLMIHRKGATRAFPATLMTGTPFADLGQPVLVPGSMGTASWLLRGIEEGVVSLFSTNHGAGRTMSRKAAAGGKRRSRRAKPGSGIISDKEFEDSMAGILLLCEDPRSIKEEAPAAYKDIDAVIDTVVGAGLASPVARFVPLAVLKG
jgi:tRNA-splicing ligase RtcB